MSALGHSRPRRSKPREHVCPLLPESRQTGRRLGTSACAKSGPMQRSKLRHSINSSARRGVGDGRFSTVAKCRFENWRSLLRHVTSQLGSKHQSAAPHHERQRLFPREPLEVTQYGGNEFQPSTSRKAPTRRSGGSSLPRRRVLVGGTSRPSALAILRLTTSSYLFGAPALAGGGLFADLPARLAPQRADCCLARPAHAYWGVVRNVPADASAPRSAVSKSSAAPVSSANPAIACTS
jgi:hypothetical protein